VAQITLASLSVTISVFLGLAPEGVLQNVALSAVAGLFAGIGIIVLRSITRKSDISSESFVSAVLSKGLAAPHWDGIFWERVFVGAFVGIGVGAINGAGGIINFLQLMDGSAQQVLQGSHYPLIVFLGGGYGGPGAGGLLSLLFTILVIILAAIVVGICVGSVFHLAIGALAGMTKGSTKALILEGLSERSDKDERAKRHPIRDAVVGGARRGALVGFIAGALESAFTAIGIVQYFNPGGG